MFSTAVYGRNREWSTPVEQALFTPNHVLETAFSRILKAQNIFFLFAIFILHSRESELYHYILDGTTAIAWEFPFSKCLGHLSFS